MTDSYFKFQNVIGRFDMSLPFLRRVIKQRKREHLTAVDDVSFQINRGETLSLVGESGCGKSTVARLAAGVYTPASGSISFDGYDLSEVKARRDLRRKVNMIFQDPLSSLNPQWRVKNIIAEPIRTFNLLNSKVAERRRVNELLERVGLSTSDGERFPHEFSGGQRQRISIARALASEPEFLICDEPTSALDVSVQAQILNLMSDLQKENGLTYLFISHNLSVVRHISENIAVMYLGRIVEYGSSEDVFNSPQHPYTRMLLHSVPDISMEGRKIYPIHGEVPNPINPPTGCTFNPRCPYMNDRCKLERPKLLVSNGVKIACHRVEEGGELQIDSFAPTG